MEVIHIFCLQDTPSGLASFNLLLSNYTIDDYTGNDLLILL